MRGKTICGRKIQNHAAPFPGTYWVIPGRFLAGEFPGAKRQRETKDKMGRLMDCGIRTIINLMHPDETDRCGHIFTDYVPAVLRIAEQKGIAVNCLRFPITDFQVPKVTDMVRIQAAITAAIQDKKPVYVHCLGGVGRTGTVVGCFLLENGMATPGHVLETMAALRQTDPKAHGPSPETAVQQKFVTGWLEIKKGGGDII